MNHLQIVPSDRIDYCSDCKAEHGYNCPTEEAMKHKKKLIMLKGLPASGKSTYATELVEQGFKRVNKDELRLMMDGGKYSREREKMIKTAEDALAVIFLSTGHSVVVDDTNFAYEDHWRDIAEKNDALFEVKFFDTSLMECIDRDSKRGAKSVGAKVIYRMYEQYLQPKAPEWSEAKQNAYIFDIDGTLAKATGRSPYDYSLVHTDTPKHSITMIARILKASGLPIIIVSGRTDDCKIQTMQWLSTHSIPFDEIHMRKAGDTRKDSIIKQEIYENELKDKYNILAVFDDRNQVVEMWRSLGLDCLQVAYGHF